MQAVKLHQESKPYLGFESYLIPIFDWKSGRFIVNRWLSHLNRQGGEDNYEIKFITLVQVPKDHPIAIHLSPVLKGIVSRSYAPMSEIDQEEKKQVAQRLESLIYSGCLFERYNLPELILGAPLSKKDIKWTKNVDLLYGRKNNVKVRKSSLE